MARAAISWPTLMLSVFTITFKAALVAYQWSFMISSQPIKNRSSAALTCPIVLSDPIDWTALGTAGIDGKPIPDESKADQMSIPERFVYFGGPCTLLEFGLLTKAARTRLLLHTAELLSTMDGTGRPISNVLANILRTHAMMG